MKTPHIAIVGLAFIIIMVLINTFTLSQPLSMETSTKTPLTSVTGVLVPLYAGPGPIWDSVVQTKLAHPLVPMVIIINPSNGPGSTINPSYVTGVQKLQSAGIVVIGYVFTSYGSKNSTDIKTEIDTYKSWYGVTGIFFDEMAYVPGFENYYSSLSQYAKSQGLKLTVGNPGQDTIPSYIGTVDNIVLHDDPGVPLLSDLQGWHTAYPKSNFSFISFGLSPLDQAFLNNATNYVGYEYMTDDNLPDPFDTLPSYFDTLVGDLDNFPPAVATSQLINTINGMNLPQAVGDSLDAKLESVISSLNSGNNNTAKNQLNAFVMEVNAQIGKKLLADQASQLVDQARDIINKIS